MISTHFTIVSPLLKPVGATLAVVATLAIAAPELAAQRGGPRQGAAQRAPAGTNVVEIALRLAERLELTQEQRDQLESVRAGVLERRAAQAARMMNLQSELRAGIRERASVREDLAGIREEAVAIRNTLREQSDGILTDEQKTELRQLARRVSWRQGISRGRPQMDRERSGRGRGAWDRGRGGRGDDRSRGWRRTGGRGGM